MKNIFVYLHGPHRSSLLLNKEFSITKTFELRKFFDYVLTSALLGVKKPDPKIFKEALDHFGILPEEAVYVGDDLFNDIYGAKSLGLRTIHMEKGYEFPTRSKVTVDPDAKVKKISEIIPIIEDWIRI